MLILANLVLAVYVEWIRLVENSISFIHQSRNVSFFQFRLFDNKKKFDKIQEKSHFQFNKPEKYHSSSDNKEKIPRKLYFFLNLPLEHVKCPHRKFNLSNFFLDKKYRIISSFAENCMEAGNIF